MSSLFRSTVIKGNKLTEFAQTTATVGIPIPKIFGRAPTDGNVIFAPLPPKENRSVKRQGKGGVKQESFTYTLSYAIAFCQGPIYGYWWIKRNGKVVYTQDPNAPIEDAAFATKWLQKATLYYGTSSQLPDSTIESYKGTGSVSAFRYLAYIVVEDDDVTDGGGAVPSYEAVPIATAPEIYLTSKPYTQIIYDEVDMTVRPTGGDMVLLLLETGMEPDDVDADLVPTGGELFEVPPPEIIDDVDADLLPTGGELLIPPPGTMEPHPVDADLLPTGGQLAIPPLGNLNPDPVDADLLPTGGELGDNSSLTAVSELLFAGADASTTFTDTTGKVWTPFGNVQIDTSLGDQRALFDGNGDYLTTPHHTSLMLGGNFVIEFIIRNATFTGAQIIVSKGYTPQAPDSWRLQTVSGTGRLVFYDMQATSGQTAICTESAGTPVINTDYTIRVERFGAAIFISRDGVIVAAGACTSTFASTSPMAIGGGTNVGFTSNWFNGWIKNFSIRK